MNPTSQHSRRFVRAVCRNRDRLPDAGRAKRDWTSERGVALVLAIVVVTALTALGLGVMALGALETETARDGLASRQAAFAAEAGLRTVKHWFDAPAASAGSWMVPAPGEVDRTRRRVDPDGDGTYEVYAGAPAPWNVVYRQGTDDLFERPYRGAPRLAAEGDADGPDLVIDAASTNPAVVGFLARLSGDLFPDGPGPNLALTLTRIAVYGPPHASIGGSRVRLGVATIEVAASVVRRSPDGDEALATARAVGVLQEIPYAAPGPLSAAAVENGAGLDVRWGTLAAAGALDLGPAPSSALAGGWPWVSFLRRLVADADGDGTGDDADGDGRGDLEEWLGLADATVQDPWLRVLSGGAIIAAPASTPQPYPFAPGSIPGSYAPDADRSSFFQGMAGAVSFRPPAGLFRAAAADGGPAAHLYRYVPGSSPPLFREGSEPPVTFESATHAREGFFYFDTADSASPRDANGDGTSDNLTPPVLVTDPGWWSAGCIHLNAASFSFGVSNRAGSGAIAPPGEPFADLDADGTWDAGETLLRLAYPADPLASGAGFTRLGIATDPALGPRRDLGPTVNAPLSFAGLLLNSGRMDGGSNARVFGAVAIEGGVSVPPAPGLEALQILYDGRLRADAWPDAASRLPRTVWQRRSVSP